MKPRILLLGALLLFTTGGLAADSNQPIAEVYGEKVTVDMLGIPDSMVEEQRRQMSGSEFDSWLMEGRKSQLAYGIMQEARKRFLQERKLEPTEEEIDSWLAFMKRSNEKMEKEIREEIARLEKGLREPGLDPGKRSRMEKSLSLAKEVLPSLGQSETEESRLADRQVAGETVSQWKFYRAIYHEHGGRVIAQQAGYEPIDAIRAFLDGLKARGDYRILDPAYEGVFQETYDYIAGSNHTFVDKAEADRYFASPWWLDK